MKRTAIVLTLMFSISILSGCLGGNSSGENESVVTDLQAQIDNLTVENQQHEDDINSLEDQLASSSSVVSEIESSLSEACLLYTSPSPRDLSTSRMPSSA